MARKLWTIRVIDSADRPVSSGRYVVRDFPTDATGEIPSTGTVVVRSRVIGWVRTEIELADVRGVDGTSYGAGEHPLRIVGEREAVAVVEPARRASGRIVDPDGRPVAGARVRLDPFARATWAVTDAEGRFAFEGLRPGTHRVVATPPERDLLVGEGRIVAGGPEATIALDPGALGVVRVVAADGAPVPGVDVWAVYPPAQGELVDDVAPVSSCGTTDLAGTVAFPRLDPGRILEVRTFGPPELARRTSSWRPPEPITIVLEPSRALTGVVVGEDGRPIPQAEVWADEGWGSRETTDRHGGFRLDLDDAAIPATLHVRHARWGDNDQVVAVAGPPDDARVVARRAVTLEVDVPDLLRGRALEWFEAVDVHASLPDLGVPAAGPLVVTRLAPDARLTFWAPLPDDDRYALLEDVPADAGRVALTLREGAPLSGRLRGAELPRFVVVRRGRLSVRSPVDDEGRFEVRGLPPGDWTIAFRDTKHAVRTGVPAEIEIGEER